MIFFRKPYSVSLSGRSTLIYKTDGKSLTINCEMLFDSEFDLVVYNKSIENWDSPNSTTSVSKADMALMKERVTKDLKRLKIEWQV